MLHGLEGDQQNVDRHLKLQHVDTVARQHQDGGQQVGLLDVDFVSQLDFCCALMRSTSMFAGTNTACVSKVMVPRLELAAIGAAASLDRAGALRRQALQHVAQVGPRVVAAQERRLHQAHHDGRALAGQFAANEHPC